MMNIFTTKIGDKVRFLNVNGYEINRTNAIEAGLKEGNTYIVSGLDIGSWSSDVFLEGFGNTPFNTVMFDNIKN